MNLQVAIHAKQLQADQGTREPTWRGPERLLEGSPRKGTDTPKPYTRNPKPETLNPKP